MFLSTMLMKILHSVQNILIGLSLFLLVYLPLFSAFGNENIVIQNVLYRLSFFSVFLVMIVRPLADIFSHQQWLRKLVILRKGFGVLSASIIVGFMIGAIIEPGSHYIVSIFTAAYWSIDDCSFFAHLGDMTGLILLVTSNNLSMIVLRKNWKRIQQLAYVYFYAGGIYESCVLNHQTALYAMLIVTVLLCCAFVLKKTRQHT